MCDCVNVTITVCDCADEKQLLEFRQQEVDALQCKVTTLRAELKTEMNYAKHLNDSNVRHLCFYLCISVVKSVSKAWMIWHDELMIVIA